MTDVKPIRSSRPTTSAASTARRWTARSTTCSAAPSPACSPTCATSRPPSCGSGSAATCACRRRRWPARLRDGLVAEGASVVDAGMVGTEMLYFLVGSRELDGGAMVTASHNPKAYTGVKLVREGALALSGDAGIGEIRDLIAGGCPTPPGRRRGRGGRHLRRLPASTRSRSIDAAQRQAAARSSSTAATAWPAPMVGPLLERLPLDLVETYWVPDGEFPDHEPNPLLPENRQFIIDRVLAEGADLGIAWDGDADRCFFIDDNGEFVDGDFLTALLARQVLEQEARRATILYDVRASRAVPDTVARRRRHPAHQPRRPRLLQAARCASTTAAFGGEVSGHYYFRDFCCADSGTLPALLVLELLSAEGRPLSELVGEFRERYFISGEINSEVADQEAKMEEIAAALLRRGDHLARRRLGRLPRLALQRPPLEHRAAAAPQPRVARLARGHGGQARRGAGVHPSVTARGGARARPSAAGITAPPDPDPVRGRAGQLLPARGRAADARRHRARTPASRSTSCSASSRRPGHSIDEIELVDHHPPAHRPPRPGRDRRRALRRRGRGDRRRRPVRRELRRPTPSATTSSPAG